MGKSNATRHRHVPLALAAALLVGSVVPALPAAAFSIVNDPPHTIKTVMGWIESYKQDLKQIQQWRDQLKHYEQQLVSAGKLLDRSMPMSMEFEERALDYGMEDKCRDPNGGDGGLPSLSQLWRRLAPDMNGDIKQAQYEICQSMVMAANSRFNEQVRMIDNIQDRDRELKAIATRAQAVGTSQGKLESVKAELSQFLARATMDMQYSESTLVAYDGLLVSLAADQQRLAERALRGGGNPGLGSVVQGLTLKGALNVARQRDR